LLALASLAACESSTLTPQDGMDLSRDRPFDTLHISQRTSYAMPDSIAQIERLKLFIGPQPITIDLIAGGRMYFRAPDQAAGGELRLYRDNVLTEFHVKHVDVSLPKVFPAYSAKLSAGLGYPGEVGVIDLREESEAHHIALFIDNKPVVIDSTKHIPESWIAGRSLFFRFPQLDSTRSCVVLVDSLAYRSTDVSFLQHTGGFLDGKNVQLVDFLGVDVLADNNIFMTVDTGIIVSPQSTMRMEVEANVFDTDEMWREDSLIFTSFAKQGASEETFNARLYVHPTKNLVSGKIFFDRVMHGGSVRFSFEIVNMHWIKADDMYWLIAAGPATTSAVRNFTYRSVFGEDDQYEERVERLFGGGNIEIRFLPKK
jgi:hypothetical protein